LKLLDLFCGAGGAAVGYSRAGFDEIVGVDHVKQPRYPFAFVQGDALEYLAAHGHEFDVIHASPPCQRYIRGGMVPRERHPDLLGAARDALKATGVAWVIENVPGAPMRGDVMLCGSMFGLGILRHRYFETAPPLGMLTLSCNHTNPITGVYGHPHGSRGAWRGARRPMLPGNLETWSREMGIDWMTTAQLANAIPPAYTEFIGRHLMAALTEGGKTSRVPRSPIAPSARYVEGMVRDGARGANGGRG
jgi:DNA (cytosine-5)-methyltransferase 1